MNRNSLHSTVPCLINAPVPGLLDELTGALDAALIAQPSLFAYVLLDCAFDEACIGRYRKMHPNGALLSLYDRTELQGLIAVSPCLVQLSGDAAVRKQNLAPLLRIANGKPMLSVLTTTHDLPALKTHFMPFLQTETEDGQRFVLRFADTRILPVLVTALTPPQQRALLAPVANWWTINRMGALSALPLPDCESGGLHAPVPFSSLPLSNEQFSRMLDAAEADAVIEQLRLIVPEHCAAFQPGRLHQFITEQLCHATEFSVEGTPDRIAYCVGAFNANGALHENAHAVALLKSKSWRPGELASALAELPDECWLAPVS